MGTHNIQLWTHNISEIGHISLLVFQSKCTANLTSKLNVFKNCEQNVQDRSRKKPS
jgi:sorbitol-specific phosphotransferase system component IIA